LSRARPGARRDVAGGGDLRVVVRPAAGAVEQADHADRAAARRHRQERRGRRLQAHQQIAGLARLEDRGEPVPDRSRDDDRLPRPQRLVHEGGAAQRGEPDGRVAGDQVVQGRVGVRRADVAQRPVLVDEGDEAEVGELGDEQPGQAGDGLLGVQRAGQLGGDVGHQARPSQGALQVELRGLAGGDVEEVDRQPVRRRPGAQLVPAVERRRVVGLEGHRATALARRSVVRLEVAADGRGEQVPQHAAEQLVARAAQDPLGLGVDVGEAPVLVQRVEGRRHGLEDAGGARLAVVQVGGVVGRPEHALGRAVGPGQRPAPRGHPAGGAVGCTTR
jgi:hypothetical protein